MGEREWWANVYERGAAGSRAATRREAEVMNGEHGGLANGAKFRIHVRLKPEGAPKRYRDAHNRFAWEFDPEDCNRLVAHGFRPEDVR